LGLEMVMEGLMMMMMMMILQELVLFGGRRW
jgi:hypothetical protein